MGEQLILHEGIRLEPYLDTEGIWTVGIGYNLDARGIATLEQILGRKLSVKQGAVPVKIDGRIEMVDCPYVGLKLTREEALKVLRVDIRRYEKATIVAFPFYLELDEIRQRVVLDMAFNMGFGALSFKNTRRFIEARNWSRAVQNLYQSKWARQVDDGEGGRFGRADRLGRMLLTGEDYTA